MKCRQMKWQRCRCCGFVVTTMSLAAVLTVASTIRDRLSVPQVHVPHRTRSLTPTSATAMTQWPTTVLVRNTSPSGQPRNVWLDIDDVAVLLRRLQNIDPDDQPGYEALRRVSKQLNKALRTFQQSRCRMPEVDFTETGAWCQTAVNSLHIIDRRFANTLAHFLAGATVLSLGDGTGVYRELILNVSKVKQYDAYDGAPFSEETTKGAVRYLDLSVPQLWLPSYDWVVCLEVIEHIPAKFESIVLDNVIRPANIGVVLSWANPYQPGAMHINPRPADYVEEELKGRGLVLDANATELLRNGSELSWFQQNTLVYRKKSATSKPRN